MVFVWSFALSQMSAILIHTSSLQQHINFKIPYKNFKLTSTISVRFSIVVYYENLYQHIRVWTERSITVNRFGEKYNHTV